MRASHVTNNPATPRLTKASLRRGVSLIELMVVISIVTVLFGMVGVVFHRLFLAEQVAMRAALTERTVSRLAVQFRGDVHASTVAMPEVQDGTTRTFKLLHSQLMWVMEFPAIVYTARDGEVLREQFGADGKLLNREVYRLPECRVSFPNQTENLHAVLISLAIERQGSTVTPQPQAVRPYRTLVIEAFLSRDDYLALGLSIHPAEPVKEESK